MKGTFRPQKRVARMTLRVQVRNPGAAGVVVTDVMLQPGAAASGFLPHVRELPWSGGIT